MTCWITPDIGTGRYEDYTCTSGVEIVDVRNMVDRNGNSAAAVRAHISRALMALESGRRVVVCCDHGISRSSAIAAAVISQWHGISFDAALRQMLVASGYPEVRVEVLAAVREALPAPAAQNDRKESRVLLTGGNGGLGSVIAATAPAEQKALAPDRKALDLLQGPALIDLYMRQHDITRVMHFAHPRVVNVSQSLGQALTMLRNLLDACVANGTTLMFASSWHVFSGYRQTELLASETVPPKPVTCLGDTNFLCETLIDQYVDRHGLSAVIVRSGPVLGSQTAPHFLRTMCRRAARGETIVTHRYSNGLPALDFVAADDYGKAAWGLLQMGATGIFHVGTGRLISTVRVAELTISALESSSLCDLQSIEDSVCNVRMDAGKLSRHLGWRAEVEPELAISRYAKGSAIDTNVTSREDMRLSP